MDDNISTTRPDSISEGLEKANAQKAATALTLDAGTQEIQRLRLRIGELETEKRMLLALLAVYEAGGDAREV